MDSARAADATAGPRPLPFNAGICPRADGGERLLQRCQPRGAPGFDIDTRLNSGTDAAGLKRGRRRCRGMDSGARFASNTAEQNTKAAGWHFDQRMPRELQWRL